tara:strand:+ start:118 stop:756 length:639 start_codon:yes stop_codon:yes gene_type:complete
MKRIQNLRVDYSGHLINMEKMKNNPIEEFKLWFENAKNNNIVEPNAMILSTLSKKGLINSRTVLLKNIKDDGFIFFTNYESKKAIDIKKNKIVSSVFLWKKIERQIIITGNSIKIPRDESIKYFHSRPEKSKIAAWASKQSSELVNTNKLMERFKYYEMKFKGKKIPMPNYWGGYIIIPNSIEFWQGRASRMHDRIIYKKTENKWEKMRLYP